jgi:nitrite reductase (NO-forming)
MLAAAAGAGIGYAIDPVIWLHWLALHLALLGGVSQLVLGAGQFFVCAFLATTPPSRRLLGVQLCIWNGGTLLVAVGVPTGAAPLVDAGGALIVIDLLVFAATLYSMQRRSLQRARWAVRWYQASATCLALGCLVGVLLAGGVGWSHGSLLGAHLTLNLAGWLGTAIVGTLQTFFPSLTGTQLRLPRLQGPTLALWLTGVAEMALGAAFASYPALIGAWLELTAAAVLLTLNLIASLRARSIPLSLAARLVALAQAFLPAGLVLGLIATLASGEAAPFTSPVRAPLAILLLAGWIGITVAGSLLHLLAVIARVRRFVQAMPAPQPLRDGTLAILCAVAVAGLALAHVRGLHDLTTPMTVLLVAATALLATRVASLALRHFWQLLH